MRFDEELSLFYVEKVCGEADIVYRFAYVLTLNPKNAFECVRTAFRAIVDRLPEFVDKHSIEIREFLMAQVWVAGKGQASKGGGSPLVGFFQALSLDARASLFAVDLAGLTVAETGRVLNAEQAKVREHLVDARQRLVSHFQAS